MQRINKLTKLILDVTARAEGALPIYELGGEIAVIIIIIYYWTLDIG